MRNEQLARLMVLVPVMVMPSWTAPSWQLAHGVSLVRSLCLTVVCGVKVAPMAWQSWQLAVSRPAFSACPWMLLR